MKYKVSEFESCSECIHCNIEKVRVQEWHCDRNSIADVKAQGYSIDESSSPDPEACICDDYEPP